MWAWGKTISIFFHVSLFPISQKVRDFLFPQKETLQWNKESLTWRRHSTRLSPRAGMGRKGGEAFWAGLYALTLDLNISKLPKTSPAPHYCLPAIMYCLFEYVNPRQRLQQTGEKHRWYKCTIFLLVPSPGRAWTSPKQGSECHGASHLAAHSALHRSFSTSNSITNLGNFLLAEKEK